MADFIVWATFDSIWGNFAANPQILGGPRDATISPTDDGNINVGQGDEFTYVGIPAGAGQFQGPFEMRSFTMSNGGTAVWMTGVGNSGGIVIPTNEIAYNTLLNGTTFTVTSNTVISSFPYANIFVPAGTVVADAMNDTSSTSEDASVTVSVLNNDDGTGNSITAISQGANGGSVTNNGTSVTYNPNGQFEYLAVGETATDTFTYTITDSNGATDTATVTVTITGANDGPVGNTGSSFGVSETQVNNGLNVGVAGRDASDADLTDTVTASITGVVQSGDKTGVLSDSELISIAAYVDNTTSSATIIDNTETETNNAVFRLNFGADNDPTRFDYLGAGETLSLSFTITITDSQGATNSFVYIANINGENDVPVAVDDGGTGFVTEENTTFTTDNVLSNDTDADMSDMLTILSVDTVSLHGAVISDNGDGTFVYDPNGRFDHLTEGEQAVDSFTYTVSDGNGGTDTATVRITINGVNDAPTILAGGSTVLSETEANSPFLIAGAAGFWADIDLNDVVTGSISGVTLSGDGASNLTEADILSILALAPIGVGVIGDGGIVIPAGSTEQGVDLFFNGTSPTLFDFLADGDQLGLTIEFTATDGQGATDTGLLSITIIGENDVPIAVDDGGMGYSTDEDTGFTTANVLTNDTDPDMGDVLTISTFDALSVLGAMISSNGDGTFNYDPTGVLDFIAAGETVTDSFTYTVSDGNGGTDTAMVSIEVTGVNDAPFFITNVGGSFFEDTFNAGYVSGFDGNTLFDADLTDIVTTEITSVVQSGDKSDFYTNAELLAFTKYVGLFSGGPVTIDSSSTTSESATLNVNVGADNDPTRFDFLQAGDTLNLFYLVTATDSQGATATQNYQFTIVGVNDAPDAVDDGGMGYSTDEDTGFTTAIVLANDTDPDLGDTLSVTAFDGTSANGALISSNGDGTFNYNPNGQFDYLAVGEMATDTFTYTVSDGNGGTDTATVTITINGVNDAPTANDDVAMTDEDNQTAPIGVLANDTDPDATDVLTVDSFNDSATIGSVMLNMDGTFSYDPNGQFDYLAAGESTTDSFTYSVSDGNGGMDTGTVTITIVGMNDAPDANDDIAVTDEDNPTASIDILANETDSDASDVLTVVSFNDTGVMGVVTLNPDNTFTYDPNGQFEYLAVGETATESFTYTISDGNGGMDTATVTVTINGVNDAPQADDDYCYSPVGEIIAGNVLDSDTDVDASDVLSASLVSDVSHGTLTLNSDGSFTYLANAGFTGVDQFTYEVSDGNGGTDTATVTLVTGTFNGGVFIGDDTAETFPGLGEDLYGSDRIDGRGGDDLIYALTGDDNVTAGGGSDTVAAGNGDDSVKGQGGDDIIIGDAAGKDTFKGPDGNDTLFGNGGDDKVAGQSGDDYIEGNDGRDELQGNDGVDTIKGGAGDDLISGGADRDRLFGNAGDDEICGDGGNDIIRGGFGWDLIFGGAGADFINGEDGNDTMLGGNGRDTIVGKDGDDLGFGGAGIDSMKGDAGNDTLVGGDERGRGDDITGNDGDDLIFGEGGEDNLQGSDGQDTVLGGIGADDIDGGKDEDVLLGEDGDDDVDGGAGDDKLFGGAGDDSLNGNDDDDFMEGEDGHDDLRGGHGNDTMLGGAGDDSITGSDDFDVEPGFFGDDGNDKIFGENGNDVLEGVNGNDFIDGGNHDDLISGGNGDDILRGEAGVDTITGDDGNDQIDGGGAGDLLSGGLGNDTVLGAGGDDVIAGNDGDDCLDGENGNDIVSGGEGNDSLDGDNGDDLLSGGNGDDVIQGAAGNDVIEGNAGDDLLGGGNNDGISSFAIAGGLYVADGGDQVFGGAGNDTIVGGSGEDYLVGGDDDDLIFALGTDVGLTGFDTVYGGLGDDTIVGGSGSDVLFGNSGADDFIVDIIVTTDSDGNITNIVGGGFDGDTIMDFDGNQEDQICFNITLTDGSVSNFSAQMFFEALDNFTTLSSFDAGPIPAGPASGDNATFTDNGLAISFDNGGGTIFILDVSENTIFELGEVQSLNPFADTPKNFQGFWQTDEEVITFGFDKFDEPFVPGIDKDVMDMERPEMPVGPFETPSDDFTKTELMDIFEAFVH